MDYFIQFFQLVTRNKAGILPTKVAKSENAIRMGLLGASKIAYVLVRFLCSDSFSLFLLKKPVFSVSQSLRERPSLH